MNPAGSRRTRFARTRGAARRSGGAVRGSCGRSGRLPSCLACVLSSCDLPLRQVARRSSCSLEGKPACSPHASRAKPRFRLKGRDVTEVRTDQLQASEICRLAEFGLSDADAEAFAFGLYRSSMSSSRYVLLSAGSRRCARDPSTDRSRGIIIQTSGVNKHKKTDEVKEAAPARRGPKNMGL